MRRWRHDNDGVIAEMLDGFMLMVVTRRWALDVGNTHPPQQSATQPAFIWPMMDRLTRDRAVGLMPCQASLLFTL